MFEAINHHAAAYSAVYSRGQSDSSRASTSIGASQETSADKAEEVKSRQVRTEPGQKTTGLDGKPRDSFELSQEAEEIRKLQARDREVRTHEAAHAAAGGAHAGAPSYSFKRGPDGASYAVDGEVSIDVSPVAGDAEATLQKAQQVRAAALAPAEPSAQDMKVAQQAQAMAAEARSQLAKQGGSADAENAEAAGQVGNQNAQSQNKLAPAGAPANDSHSSNHSPGTVHGSRLDIKA